MFVVILVSEIVRMIVKFVLVLMFSSFGLVSGFLVIVCMIVFVIVSVVFVFSVVMMCGSWIEWMMILVCLLFGVISVCKVCGNEIFEDLIVIV